MNTEKRKVYQARAHLVKAETLIKELARTMPKFSSTFPNNAVCNIEIARKYLHEYVKARWGGDIKLENYK